MTKLLLEEQKVLRRRLLLEKLFKPLAKPGKVEVFVRPRAGSIEMGLGLDNFGQSARRAKHPSRAESVYINYFEVWIAEGKRSFYLEKAYLHLDQAADEGDGEREILAFHCDPSTPSTDADFTYKSGPHIHVPAKWGANFHKAHIALCLQNREQVCSDLASFDEALALSIQMINDEFVQRLVAA